MKSLELDVLISKIGNAKYKKRYSTSDGYYDCKIIDNDEEKALLQKVVYEWATDLLDYNYIDDIEKMRIELSELHAKCFAYERIIEKSNFAPMIFVDGNSEVE